MIRGLLTAGIVLTIGYIVGAVFGFRAAVVDYVENDSEKIESMASDIYPSPAEGAASGDENIPSAIEEAAEQDHEDAEENDAIGFQ